MQIENVQGITYAEMRPRKPITSPPQIGGFPVYPDLVRDLCDPGFVSEEERQARALHICAVLSAWAYSDASTLSSIMVRMGLEKNRCRQIVVANDTMFVRSTAYLIQSACGRVAFLTYRGTEPFELATWATDADVKPVAVKPDPNGKAAVHGGFYRNQRATWFDVVAGLQRASAGDSILARSGAGAITQPQCERGTPDPGEKIAPLEAFYVTGHSLGGAMAVLAAYRMQADGAYSAFKPYLKALYTFGQPMVGNPEFAEQCRQLEFFASKYVRCVYQRDVVPHLPPSLAGPHEHFGALLSSETATGSSLVRWAPSGERTEQVRSFTAILAAATDVAIEQVPLWRDVASLARKVPILRDSDLLYSLYDHSPTNYVACSQPPGVVSELGDF
jgi:hypothetical protein